MRRSQVPIGVQLPYKEIVVRLLDRPWGRPLLGKVATRYLRSHIGDDINIIYREGMWARKVGAEFLPDGPTFNYSFQDFGAWKNQTARYVADTNEYWLYQYHPKAGDVVIDVGAGRGEDTLTFSRSVGKAGLVLAIEAHPFSYSILRSFCRLNDLMNAIPLHAAVMDKPGAVRIIESETSWLENAVEPVSGVQVSTVESRTLDDICAEYGVNEIAFLKMNIEGAERFALCGMKRTLPRIRQICVACHDFRADAGHGEVFRTRAFVEQLLTSSGFNITSRRDDERDYVRDHVFGMRAD